MHASNGIVTPQNLEREITKLVYASARADIDEAEALGLHKSFKKIKKALGSVIKTTVGVVKKVAPVAAAGAAIWYGAPYVATAAKSLFAGGSVPAVQPGGGGQAPVASATVTNAAMSQAQKMASAQGVNLTSPGAQDMLRGYIQYQQQKLQNRVAMQPQFGPPRRNDFGTFTQPGFSPSGYQSSPYPQAKPALPGWVVPVGAAAIGIPALMMMMR